MLSWFRHHRYRKLHQLKEDEDNEDHPKFSWYFPFRRWECFGGRAKSIPLPVLIFVTVWIIGVMCAFTMFVKIVMIGQDSPPMPPMPPMPGKSCPPGTFCENWEAFLHDHPGLVQANSNHQVIETTSSLSSATSTLSSPPTASTTTSSSANSDGRWEFNTTRDERSYGLSKGQCDAAFPGLFAEIERAVEHRKGFEKHVQGEEIDISWAESGAIRATILDQQLYILDTRLSGSDHETPRVRAILHALHRAIITSPEPVPDIEFAFSISDIPDPDHLNKTIWALSRTVDDEEKWLMSDFGYWSWPLKLVGGYEQIRQEIEDIELEFSMKKKQAVWRGAVKTNEHRKELLRVTKEKEWADVKTVKWSSAADPKVSDGSPPISMPEHCQYQFLIHTEGRSYSGRGKYLQNCNSVVIMPNLTWIEPHHALLISSGPKQNFVEVQMDFSDLEENVLGLLEDQEKAQLIAHNSVETFRDRYLTPAAQACYWRRMIEGWAEVSFVPQPWKVGEDGVKHLFRGVPFETFVIEKASESKPCTWSAKLMFRC